MGSKIVPSPKYQVPIGFANNPLPTIDITLIVLDNPKCSLTVKD